MDARNPRRRWQHLSIPIVLLWAAVLGPLLFVGLGCGSLSKGALRLQLEELPKNAALQGIQPERRRLTMEFGGRQDSFEFVYAHLPCEDPLGAQRAPVVLVHGTPSTLFTWTEIAAGGVGFDGLSANRDVYLIEVAGHGVAPEGPQPLSFQACADYLVAAIRALDLQGVYLVGQSYGSEFAWRAALDAPELIRGLSLLSSSGIARREGDWLPEEVEMRENSFADWGYLINSRERVQTALAPHFRELPPNRVDEFFLVCENSGNWEGMIDLVRDESGAREAELAELRVPTLLIWGEDDLGYAADYYAQRFADMIPAARLELLPETGHYPHEERPGETIQLLDRFFSELETAQ